MGGLQLAAFYPLQHCLAGYAEAFGGLQHGQIALRGLLDKERLELIGDADAPGCARGDLLLRPDFSQEKRSDLSGVRQREASRTNQGGLRSSICAG